MRNSIILLLLGAMFSCSKSSNNPKPYIPYTDSLRILESVALRVKITKASPYDSAHNFSSDSLLIAYNRLVGPPDYLQTLSVVMIINSTFSFGIDTTNYLTRGNDALIITYAMLPSVNSNFVTNTTYQNTYTGDYGQQPFFLSMHAGNGIGVGKYFLSQDSIPSDATTAPQVKIVCKLVFTKKYKVEIPQGGYANLADGIISGSYEAHFGTTDINKYVSSFDFSCNFQGITISP